MRMRVVPGDDLLMLEQTLRDISAGCDIEVHKAADDTLDVWWFRLIVPDGSVTDPRWQIALSDARAIDDMYQLHDEFAVLLRSWEQVMAPWLGDGS